ncbi:MAG: hypothetical protein HS122_16270 [Opitutaceae bacterium]|nr:hypothetical protein [Opitutaceae bacterium]
MKNTAMVDTATDAMVVEKAGTRGFPATDVLHAKIEAIEARVRIAAIRSRKLSLRSLRHLPHRKPKRRPADLWVGSRAFLAENPLKRPRPRENAVPRLDASRRASMIGVVPAAVRAVAGASINAVRGMARVVNPAATALENNPAVGMAAGAGVTAAAGVAIEETMAVRISVQAEIVTTADLQTPDFSALKPAVMAG